MEKKNIKCYNSGKIGGLSYLQAYKNFENADQEIAAMGFTPVNPIILGLKPSRPYWMHMCGTFCCFPVAVTSTCSRTGSQAVEQESSSGWRNSWVFRYGFREILVKKK